MTVASAAATLGDGTKDLFCRCCSLFVVAPALLRAQPAAHDTSNDITRPRVLANGNRRAAGRLAGGSLALNLRAGRVFADTWDLERFSNCPVCLEERRKRLHAMNLSQTISTPIACSACAGE